MTDKENVHLQIQAGVIEHLIKDILDESSDSDKLSSIIVKNKIMESITELPTNVMSKRSLILALLKIAFLCTNSTLGFKAEQIEEIEKKSGIYLSGNELYQKILNAR